MFKLIKITKRKEILLIISDEACLRLNMNEITIYFRNLRKEKSAEIFLSEFIDV